ADTIQDEKQEIKVRKASYNLLDSSQRKRYIKELENQMLEAAKNLEFERAAVLRDEINNIKNGNFDNFC
ncbi:MAG: UvrB/UvrC motif-containing protein, partial [Sphaerochaetaceae bacterium]|nr:UvrB/UvrC motif-containing protein [Sphaerochaetaceae bacterium]